ncbi:unnamed protein product [Scytosiphon promiscuus]
MYPHEYRRWLDVQVGAESAKSTDVCVNGSRHIHAAKFQHPEIWDSQKNRWDKSCSDPNSKLRCSSFDGHNRGPPPPQDPKPSKPWDGVKKSLRTYSRQIWCDTNTQDID